MKTKTKLLLAAGAVAMLSLGGLAGLAQADMQGGMGGGMGAGHCGMGRGGGHGHGMMGQRMMERYDADKDGKVTQAEIDKNRADWLAEADADKNGTLSLEEFKVLWLKSRNEMMVREFQFFDRDGNGQVTIEEYQGPLSGIVADRDQNNDGSLGADDRPAPGEGRGWRHGGMKGHGMGQGHGMMGEGMGQGMMGQGMMGQGMGQGWRHGMMGGGNGPCMYGGEGAGQPEDTPGAAPGDEPATP